MATRFGLFSGILLFLLIGSFRLHAEAPPEAELLIEGILRNEATGRARANSL